jgi:Tol biopolymer transport system component
MPIARDMYRVAGFAAIACLTIGLCAGASGGALSARASADPNAFVHPVRGNGRVAFTSVRSGDREIYSMRMDGSQQVNLSKDPGFSDTSPAWSPDGTKLAFTSERTGDPEIFVMGSDGSGQVNLTNRSRAGDSGPVWAPDGSRIAFTSDRRGSNDIWVMGSHGGGLVNLTANSPASDSRPSWSPDGASIAFTADRSGDDEIWLMAADGSNPLNLTNTPAASDFGPSWAPDADLLAFTSDRSGGQNDVFTMNADGTNQTDVTDDPSGSESDPVFTPDDGTRLLYTADEGSGAEVEALNFTPDGSTYGAPSNLTHDSVSASAPTVQPLPAAPAAVTPIEHVVLVMMENHDFDNVLGYMCVHDARCDGAIEGEKMNGDVIPLTRSPDISVSVDHSPSGQTTAINGGRMNGFSLLDGCRDDQANACYVQYQPDQMPNTTALYLSFAISDRTFENDKDASWVSHLQLVTSWRGGFPGKNPHPPHGERVTGGWGCDSLLDVQWQPSAWDQGIEVPACVPDQEGSGPYRESPVSWMPTVFDRLDEAGISYGMYVPLRGVAGYQRAICPSFAACLYGGQRQYMHSFEDFTTDALAGTLPAVSILMPDAEASQHNKTSMLMGDNWIGEQAGALMGGPDWSSSAMFITWDDCGCFYDHVRPPRGMGVRIPMLIVSPLVKPGYTDSNDASFSSMLAFIEHRYGLAPMSTEDAIAYDYAQSFDYSQEPLSPVRMVRTKVPEWELRWLEAHRQSPGPDGELED